MRAIKLLSVVWAGLVVAGIARAQVPLTDLGAGFYSPVTGGSYQGGLYPGGANVPPASHSAAALGQAALVVPRNSAGNPSGSGLIGVISIGMSNTNQEFAQFERVEDGVASRRASVVFVNTAKGGISAEIMSDPTDPYWTAVDTRLAVAGLTPAQVQVVWLKQAMGSPSTTLFPAHAVELQNHLRSIANILHDRFPNLKICYLSSRIYGGYNANPFRNEPLSYEGGFAFKWLIEEQLSGAAALNWDPSAGPVESPLLLWGPYLWANGTTPRSDGLTWVSGDFEGDFIHPALTGEAKVANMLHTFFSTDPSAQAWYAPRPGELLVVVSALADTYVDSLSPATNFGSLLELRSLASPSTRTGFVKFVRPALPRPPSHVKMSIMSTPDDSSGGTVRLVSNTSWTESGLTFSNQPVIGNQIASLADVSRGGNFDVDVRGTVMSDADGTVSYALVGGPSPDRVHMSRESAHPPRLVFVVPPPCPGDANGDGLVNAADLSVLLAQFGSNVPPGTGADFNGDGLVNSADLSVLLGSFGVGC